MSSSGSGEVSQKESGNIVKNVFSKLFKSYESLILKNPAHVSYYESIIRAMLMFTPSVRDSEISTEAVYTMTGFLSLLNDVVIKNYFTKNQRKLEKIPIDAEHLVLQTPGGRTSNIIEYLQSIIQNTELLIEIIAAERFSARIRWRAVFLIELIKAALKITLLLRTRETILVHQKVPERGEAVNSVPIEFFDAEYLSQHTFLPDPNRINASNPNNEQQPNPNSNNTVIDNNNNNNKGKVMSRQTLLTTVSRTRYRSSLPKDLLLVQAGEYLHILRPLVYLLAMSVFGRRSWFPWVFSFLIDITSHTCSRAGTGENLNTMERSELERRRMALVYYLLKTPFFDTVFLHQTVLKLIESLKNIPLLRIPITMCWELIVSYSRFYFYTCGSDS